MIRSEKQLRQKIKELLIALKKPEERVIDYHGVSEQGLDLVITKYDVFGQLRAYGIQVKSGDIKCSTSRKFKGIHGLIGQLISAFGNKVKIGSLELQLDGLYLITDGDINKPAIDNISSACRNIKPLYFLNGQDLNEFFVKHESAINKFKQT